MQIFVISARYYCPKRIKIAACLYVSVNFPISDSRNVTCGDNIRIFHLVANVRASHNGNEKKHLRDVCFALKLLHRSTLAIEITLRQ
jgi:hypothetical protein